MSGLDKLPNCLLDRPCLYKTQIWSCKTLGWCPGLMQCEFQLAFRAFLSLSLSFVGPALPVPWRTVCLGPWPCLSPSTLPPQLPRSAQATPSVQACPPPHTACQSPAHLKLFHLDILPIRVTPSSTPVCQCYPFISSCNNKSFYFIIY